MVPLGLAREQAWIRIGAADLSISSWERCDGCWNHQVEQESSGSLSNRPDRPADGVLRVHVPGPAVHGRVTNSLQAKDIGDGVAPRPLARQPFRGAKRAMDEGIAAGGNVRQFESLAKPGEIGGVPAHLIPDPQ